MLQYNARDDSVALNVDMKEDCFGLLLAPPFGSPQYLILTTKHMWFMLINLPALRLHEI